MSVKYSKWPLNITTFSYLRPSKIFPNWEFWLEKKLSGNPDAKEFLSLNAASKQISREKKKERQRQSDQIGQSFPYWAVIFFWQFFNKYRSIPNIRLLFNTIIKFLCIILDEKWIGLHFGRFFHKLIWSPWPQRPQAFSQSKDPFLN
jgi:hypothetical protein